MKGVPAVSVVIPTYDRLHCLGRAVDSVLRQRDVTAELIVVDDASPRRADQWVDARYSGVRVERLPENAGVAAARNAGAALARGRFLAFLDDDDAWEPDFLGRMTAVLEARPGAALAYCDFVSVDEQGGRAATQRSGGLGADPVRTLLLENPIRSLSLALLRREHFERAGRFRADYRMCEDRELYLRLLGQGAFVHEPSVLASKTRSDDAMTKDFARWADWAQTLLDEFFAGERGSGYRWMEGEARALWDLRLAIKCLRAPGQRLLGLSLAASALRHDAAGSARYLAARAIRRS